MSHTSLLVAVIAGAATLLGTTLGAIITYFGQRSQVMRQYSTRWDATKKDLYVKFIMSCNEDYFYLRDIYRDVIDNSRPSVTAEVRSMRYELFSNVFSEMALLGTDDVEQSASDLIEYLESLGDLLRRDRPLREIETKLDKYGYFIFKFRRAAMADLGVKALP